MIKSTKQIFIATIGLGVILTLSFCKSDKKTTDTTQSTDSAKSNSAPTTSANSNTEPNKPATVTENKAGDDTPLYSSPEGMAKFMDAVKQKFNGDVKIMDIHFYSDGRAIFPAQDPNKKENVDEYTYKNGTWDEPVPVKLSGSGKLEDNVFSLVNDLDVTKIPGLMKEIEEKTKDLEGAKINHAYATLNLFPKGADDKISIRISAVGTRKTKTLVANGKGVVKSFE